MANFADIREIEVGSTSMAWGYQEENCGKFPACQPYASGGSFYVTNFVGKCLVPSRFESWFPKKQLLTPVFIIFAVFFPETIY